MKKVSIDTYNVLTLAMEVVRAKNNGMSLRAAVEEVKAAIKEAEAR